MTTKVTITNDGPYVVEAFAVTRGSDEVVDHSTKTVEVGQSVVMYLWDEQSIRIVEPQPARKAT